MNATQRQVVAALHWPGWHESGPAAEDDVAVIVAEAGIGYESIGADGSSQEWDWQRLVPARLVDGSVRFFVYAPGGGVERTYDHGARCRCLHCTYC